MAGASPVRGSTRSTPGFRRFSRLRKAPAASHTQVVSPTAERNASTPSRSTSIPITSKPAYAGGRGGVMGRVVGGPQGTRDADGTPGSSCPYGFRDCPA